MTDTTLADLHTAIDPLPTAPDRAWAWADAGNQIAALELTGDPHAPIGEAVFAYGGLLLGMQHLALAGASHTPQQVPDLTADQARDLLPAVLEQVIAATGDAGEATPAQFTALLHLQAAAADAYVAHTGRLPR